MKRTREAPVDTLKDLLVVLGTQRYGTDWPNVATAVRAAAPPLDVPDGTARLRRTRGASV